MESYHKDNVYRECHMNIPIIPFLEKRMGQSLRLYEEDWNIDKKMFQDAARTDSAKGKSFFWICRNSGTYCAAEQDVFIEDTTANQHCRFYKARPYETVHAFIIEVTGMQINQVMGNVYQLDCSNYAMEVNRSAQPRLQAQMGPKAPRKLGCHAIAADTARLEAVLKIHRIRRSMLAKAG